MSANRQSGLEHRRIGASHQRKHGDLPSAGRALVVAVTAYELRRLTAQRLVGAPQPSGQALRSPVDPAERRLCRPVWHEATPAIDRARPGFLRVRRHRRTRRERSPRLSRHALHPAVVSSPWPPWPHRAGVLRLGRPCRIRLGRLGCLAIGHAACWPPRITSVAVSQGGSAGSWRPVLRRTPGAQGARDPTRMTVLCHAHHAGAPAPAAGLEGEAVTGSLFRDGLALRPLREAGAPLRLAAE